MKWFDGQKMSDLLKAQALLNDKYVKNWKEELELEHFKSALLCEFAEFLESTPRFGINTRKFTGWKYWKNYLEDDTQNSKIEIIDILHFGLSYHILFQYKNRFLYNDERDFEKNPFVYTITKEKNYEKEKNKLKLAYKELDEFFNKGKLLNLFNFLEILASHHNMSMYDLYKGYFLKNELNLQRIENGYLEGTYQKVDSQGNEDNRRLQV